MRRIWQVAVWMESEKGDVGTGLGTQNVLWSDSRVFSKTPESGGNCLMFTLTVFALSLAEGRTFTDPIDLQDQIFEEALDYARTITGLPALSKTFVLNALVPVDNAAWVLYARENELTDFDQMIPSEYRSALSHRHEKVASIPIASYGMPLEEVKRLVEDDGYQILKFKLGSPGSQKEMIEQDKARIEQIHQAIGDRQVNITVDGKLPYYLDMNGRYESKDTLKELLNHTKKIGAFDQIRVLEEPFPEDYKEHVGDLGVLVAADESAHTAENVKERIELGYGAMALKPAAKTLSSTLKMALIAHQRQIPCFCADLTVNPILVEWNKNVAARLTPVPGFRTGLLETNGHQNYKNWKQMKSRHSNPEASWANEKDGVFDLDHNYYTSAGGILEKSSYFDQFFDNE